MKKEKYYEITYLDDYNNQHLADIRENELNNIEDRFRIVNLSIVKKPDFTQTDY